MQLKDFNTLADAKAYELVTLGHIDDRMVNERGIFALIGMADGEALMSAIEANQTIPNRVKAWFKPSEQGIDISDTNAIAILTGMVASGDLSAINKDTLINSAYTVTAPFINSTAHDFAVAKNTITRIEKQAVDGWLKITTNADCEAHRPQVYVDIQGLMRRVAGFDVVSVAGGYITQVPRGYASYFVDNAYSVVS